MSGQLFKNRSQFFFINFSFCGMTACGGSLNTPGFVRRIKITGVVKSTSRRSFHKHWKFSHLKVYTDRTSRPSMSVKFYTKRVICSETGRFGRKFWRALNLVFDSTKKTWYKIIYRIKYFSSVSCLCKGNCNRSSLQRFMHGLKCYLALMLWEIRWN